METWRVERHVPMPTMPRHPLGQNPDRDHRVAPSEPRRRSQSRSPQQTPTSKTLPRERPRKGLARPHTGPPRPRRMVGTPEMVEPESTHNQHCRKRSMTTHDSLPCDHWKACEHLSWCDNDNIIGRVGCTQELVYNVTGSAVIAGQP